MRFKMPRPGNPDAQKKEGWDILLKDYEMKQRNQVSRPVQRKISVGLGHRLARMMKGHI